jgi:Anticodon binding domain
VSLTKLSYLQKLHAKARVAAGGDLYGDLIERAQRAVRSAFTKDDLASVGLQTDQDVRSRIDQILKAGVVWENETAFSSRYAYFFQLKLQSLQVTVPKKLGALLSEPSLAKLIRISMLSHLREFQDAATMTPSTLTVHFEAMSHAAAKAIREARPDLLQESQPGDGSTYKLAYGCVMHVLRRYIAGGQGGPSMAATMAILGPQVCRRRLSEQQAE